MREAEKEDSIEPSLSHTLDNTATPKLTSFFPLQKFKGTLPTVKMPAVCLAHLEEESVEKDEVVGSEGPDGIKGVMEEFMVCLVRAVKDVQKEEKCCYHCNILDHFICDCPVVKALRTNSYLNTRKGQHGRREPRPLRQKLPCQQCPRREHPKHRTMITDSLLES